MTDVPPSLKGTNLRLMRDRILLQISCKRLENSHSLTDTEGLDLQQSTRSG